MQENDTMTEIEKILNKISQDKIGFEEGLIWFEGFDLITQKEIIQKLIYYIQQTHPDKDTIEIGLENAPIKKTMTPVVLLKTQENYNLAFNKITNLPDSEIRKCFITLMSVFRISDKRRREIFCINGCSHEWHNID